MLKYYIIFGAFLAAAHAASEPEPKPAAKPSHFAPPSGYNYGHSAPIGYIGQAPQLPPPVIPLPPTSNHVPVTLGHLPATYSNIPSTLINVPPTLSHATPLINPVPVPLTQISYASPPVSHLPIHLPQIPAAIPIAQPITYLHPSASQVLPPISSHIQSPQVGGVGVPIVHQVPNFYQGGWIKTVPGIGGLIPQHLGYNPSQTISHV